MKRKTSWGPRVSQLPGPAGLGGCVQRQEPGSTPPPHPVWHLGLQCRRHPQWAFFSLPLCLFLSPANSQVPFFLCIHALPTSLCSSQLWLSHHPDSPLRPGLLSGLVSWLPARLTSYFPTQAPQARFPAPVCFRDGHHWLGQHWWRRPFLFTQEFSNLASGSCHT